MPLEAIGPVDPAGAFSAAEPPRSRPVEAGAFSRVLQQYMAEPRDRVAQVRAAIDAIRNGAVLPGGAGAGDAGAGGSVSSFGGVGPELLNLLPYNFDQSSDSDPFGWRSLSRRIGDELVAPGYGAIFERQIQQESGFDPAVAFGLRRSSAGAEGIAQLMPEYYPGVDRTNPEASLVAGARTMNHYISVFDGDVRKALAAYNAGLGRVQSLTAAHGDAWELALPEETRRYLAGILGGSRPGLTTDTASEVAVFGGRGPGGVLTPPLDYSFERRYADGLIDLLASAGVAVRAPADGRVVSIEGSGDASTVVIDHGNGWQSSLAGLAGLLVAAGDDVRRSDELGALAEGLVLGQGRLRFGLTLDGRAVSPDRYLLPL